MTSVVWGIEHPELVIGLVEAKGISTGPSPEALDAALDALIKQRIEGWPTDAIKTGVRKLLRAGGYKPSGRGKPASEYLAGVARKGSFPRISVLVDINNLLSLETGFPMSVLDLDRALGSAESLEIRFGRDDETYVFNQAGQEIALRGLLGIGRLGAGLVGNPVKDSQEAKTDGDSRNVIAVIYAPRSLVDVDGMLALAQRYAGLLVEHAGATSTSAWVLSAEGRTP